MQITEATTIAFLGIGGAGMRGLARIMSSRGAQIMGSDQQYERLRGEASMASYTLAAEMEAASLVQSADLVVYSDAVPPEHELRQIAQRQGIPQLGYHEALGQLSELYTTVAVTGTHGKSSTTSMLAHIFIEAGLDPTVLVGAAVPALGGENARSGQSRFFIVEADEYRNHFLQLHVHSAIITSIDFDHPDFFTSRADVVASFRQFIARLAPDGALVVPQSVHDTFASDMAWPPQTETVKESPTAVPLVLPGRHMQQNAALAVHLAGHFGVSRERAFETLRTYQGLGRRFETIGHLKGARVISDYGHHPAEIAATLSGAREALPGQRILAVFEAHTLERLTQFFDEFVRALSAADGVVVVPVFVPKGREAEAAEAAAVAQRLVTALQAADRTVQYVSNLELIGPRLDKRAPDFDAILAFSAGNLDAALRQHVSRN